MQINQAINRTCDKLRDDVIKSREEEVGEKIMARAKSILPNSSLQCEHFFLPLTLKSRSLEEPLDDFPSDDGGFLGGT